MVANPIPSMALRELEQRSRALPLEAQMRECIDLLQAPELVVDELLRSVDQIRSAPPERGRFDITTTPSSEQEGSYFYPSRELFVRGDRCSFTCLATGVAFKAASVSATGSATAIAARSAPPSAARSTPASTPARLEPSSGGTTIDYAAVTCEARPVPVLGFTAASENESAYPILLRALASLIELTRPQRFDLLDRRIYKGLLGPAPAFDLALVLWDDEGTEDPRRPLCELSRDLAEVLKNALGAEPRFPPVLLDFVCLRMNPKRFDGRMRFAWRV